MANAPARPTPRPQEPPSGPRVEALGRIFRALAHYPAPVAVPPDPEAPDSRISYTPPIEYAMGLYARHFFSTTPDEDQAAVCEAFAAVAPRVFGQADRHLSACLNEIADNRRVSAGSAAEHRALLRDLSTLATVFAGPPGGHDGEYAQVCACLTALHQNPAN